MKQQVAPLQAAEVSGIRKKIAAFDAHVTHYREVFKRYEVFGSSLLVKLREKHFVIQTFKPKSYFTVLQIRLRRPLRSYVKGGL